MRCSFLPDTISRFRPILRDLVSILRNRLERPSRFPTAAQRANGNSVMSGCCVPSTAVTSGRELATHCALDRCHVEVSQRETATHFFDLSVTRDEWQNAQERCLIRDMLRDGRRMSRGGGLPLLAHRSAARTNA